MGTPIFFLHPSFFFVFQPVPRKKSTIHVGEYKVHGSYGIVIGEHSKNKYLHKDYKTANLKIHHAKGEFLAQPKFTCIEVMAMFSFSEFESTMA